MNTFLEEISKSNFNGAIDVIFVADGYTESESNKFLDDVRSLISLTINTKTLNEPFYTFANFFNVYAAFSASEQSGMDLPDKGIYKSTAFDSSQHLSDGRGVYGDYDKVKNFINSVGNFSQNAIKIVLVNSSEYGGTGGEIAWVTASNRLSPEILMHEIGHSFGNLQDEYVDSEIAENFSLSSPDFLNSVHLTDSLDRIPWSDWLGFTDSLGTVGFFEGGYYRENGIWRATENSKMLYLNYPFSAPQKEAIIKQIYDSIGDYLFIYNDSLLNYSAVVPDSNIFSYQWKINGEIYSDESLIDLKGYIDNVAEGSLNINVSLETQDGTGMVRSPSVLSVSRENEQFNLTIQKYSIASSISPIDINILNGDCYYFGTKDDVVTAVSSNNEISSMLDTGKGNDYVVSSNANELIYLGSGRDSLFASDGSDFIDGGSGKDVVIYSSPRNVFNISVNDDELYIEGSGSFGVLRDIEKLVFSDQILYVVPPIEGSKKNDKLVARSSEGDDIYGYQGNDILNGSFGDDLLDGGLGKDTMNGGKGDDIYYVDSSKDKVSEKLNGGVDTVFSTISYRLPNNVENLTLSKNSNIFAFGNASQNTIKANEGNNTINGGLGNDILTGGYGNDIFVFNSKLNSENLDTITDFVSGEDKIALDDAIFKKLNKLKELPVINFKQGTSAEAATDYIIYDNTTGKLYYDADGSGKGVAVQIAVIGNNPDLSASDFLIV